MCSVPTLNLNNQNLIHGTLLSGGKHISVLSLWYIIYYNY